MDGIRFNIEFSQAVETLLRVVKVLYLN